MPAREQPATEEGATDDGDRVMDLLNLTRNRYVWLDLHAADKGQAIELLLDRLMVEGALPGDAREELLEAVMTRERGLSTGLECGIAIPHGTTSRVETEVAALGVFPGGEPWEADSKKFSKALSKATGYPYPPIDTGCVYTGTLADYAVSLGITAADMELSTHKYTVFEENLKALEVLVNWR